MNIFACGFISYKARCLGKVKGIINQKNFSNTTVGAADF